MTLDRLLNIVMRALMRAGLRSLRNRAAADRSPNAPRERRAFREARRQGDLAKRMRALKRFNRF